jgi:hypothetical protein
MSYTFNPFTGTFDSAPSPLKGDSAYSTLCAISADLATFEYVHSSFLPLTGGIVDGNLDVTGTTNLSGQTSIGAGTTTTLYVTDMLVGINTETPNEELTVVGDISATGVIYGSASGLTNITDSDVRSLTANWESTYNTVSSLSALWEESAEILPTVTDYLSTNNVLISSLTVIETLSVKGTLEVGGGGAGTDLFVGGNSKIGINTETPNEELTVVGDISANGLIYDETGNSSEWNSVYSSVTLTSANWGSVYASVSETSANWDSVYSSVSETSANWDSVYTSVSETSANWDSVYSSVTLTSANWDSVYSYTNSTSSDFVLTDTSNTTPGLSAVTKIVAVSALPTTQETGTLYILI